MDEIVVEGRIKNYIFTSNDSLYKVAKIITKDDDEVIIVGYFPLLQEELYYEFKGTFTFHTKYGDQLKVESFKKMDVNTKEGIVAYLSSEKFKGIGEKTATKIFEHLGPNCLKLIIDDPDALKDLSNFSKAKQQLLREQLISNRETEDIYVELYNYGLTPKMVSKLFEKYDTLALQKVKENPYRLIYEVDGFGFRKSDDLALNMGFKLNDSRRIAEGIIYALNYVCSEKGFTFLTDSQLVQSALPLLNKNIEQDDISIKITLEDVQKQLEKLCNDKKLIKEENRVYVSYLYEAELECANKILLLDEESKNEKKYTAEKLNETLSLVEQNLNIEYMDLQKDAIFTAVNNKLTIITGGPGTGKTTIIKGLITTYSYLNNLDLDSDEIRNKILLIAPTGRAAKRMSEATRFDAYTIHRALGYNYEGYFTKDETDPLTYDLIIVDESSMIDIKLANALFKAIPKKTKIVMVGDENQLPSVSPGAVLHDLIESKVFKVIRLNKIMRQAEGSNIIKLATAIKEQRLSYDIFASKKQTFFYDADSQDVLKTIYDLINLFISKGGNLQTELQVLVPMYNGVAGIDSINKMIQEKFNNSDEIIIRSNRLFKVGDKVLQLQNEPELKIMNGDIGIIKAIKKEDDKESLLIDFDSLMVNYPASNLDSLTLAYAISIHKSQGSEYQSVIMPIVPSYYQMLKRNIIYTGVTRAKNKLIIIGKYQSLLQGVNSKDDLRQTSLTRRLVKIINNPKKIIYINDPSIPFDTLGEINMENITPYSFM